MKNQLFECIPGEFDRQSAMMFSCGEWVHFLPKLLIDTVAVVGNVLPLVLVVSSELERQMIVALLSDWEISLDPIQFICLGEASMWVRDYGPGFVRNGDGVELLDFAFFPGTRAGEDQIPTKLAELLRVPARDVPLDIEGGNILSNGRGICVTTASVLAANRYRHYDENTIREIFREQLGFDQWVHLIPLMGEPTSHVDLFATFTSPDTIVVADSEDSANKWILERNVERLSAISHDGRPLNVVRIPMPPATDGVWRTYTNVVYANGTLLVPIYPDIDPQPTHIFDLYASLLPGWKIVGIDSSALSRYRGSLRCVSLGVPWLDEVFNPPEIPVTAALSTLPAGH